jgi:hypothetical protein
MNLDAPRHGYPEPDPAPVIPDQVAYTGQVPAYATYPTALPYLPYGYEPAPTAWPIVAYTVLFGLFGLIPAGRRAGRARRAGYRTARYWWAWGGTYAGMVLLAVVLLLVTEHGS